MDRDIFDDFFTHNDPLKQIYRDTKDPLNSLFTKNQKGKEKMDRNEQNSFSLDTPPGWDMNPLKLKSDLKNELDLSSLPEVPIFSSKKNCGIQNLSSEMTIPNTPEFKTPNLKKRHNVSSDSFSSFENVPENLNSILTNRLSENIQNKFDLSSFSEKESKKSIDMDQNSTPVCQRDFFINRKILDETPMGKMVPYDETTPLYNPNRAPKNGRLQKLDDSYNKKTSKTTKNNTTASNKKIQVIGQDENTENTTPNQTKAIQTFKKEENKPHFSPLPENFLSIKDSNRNSYSPIENNMKTVSLYSPSNHELLNRIEEETEFEDTEAEDKPKQQEESDQEETERIDHPVSVEEQKSVQQEEENISRTLEVEEEQESIDLVTIEPTLEPNTDENKCEQTNEKEDISEQIKHSNKVIKNCTDESHHISLLRLPNFKDKNSNNLSFSHHGEHLDRTINLNEISQEISKIGENDNSKQDLSSSSENFCDTINSEETSNFIGSSPNKKNMATSETPFTSAPNSYENQNQEMSNHSKPEKMDQVSKKEQTSFFINEEDKIENKSTETEDNCTRVIPKNVSIFPSISNEVNNLSNLANLYNLFFQKYILSLETEKDCLITFSSLSSTFFDCDPQQLLDNLKTLENCRLLKLEVTGENQLSWKVTI